MAINPNLAKICRRFGLLAEYKVYCDRNGGYAGGERELKKQLEARKMDVDNATSGGVARLKGWCWIGEQYDNNDKIESIIRAKKKKSSLDTLTSEYPQSRYSGPGG